PIELQWNAFDKAARILAEGRAKYPAEARLAVLQSELGKRRAHWLEDVAQNVSGAIEKMPRKETLHWFAPQIRAVRAKDPKEALWGKLQGELDALEAL